MNGDQKNDSNRAAFFRLVPVDKENQPVNGNLHLQAASGVVYEQWQEGNELAESNHGPSGHVVVNGTLVRKNKPGCIVTTMWRENGELKAQEALLGIGEECAQPWIRSLFRRWKGEADRRALYVIKCDIKMLGPVKSRSFVSEAEALRRVKCSETLRS